jgi:hypothetical protein
LFSNHIGGVMIRLTLDAKFQLYHGENKLQFDVMMMMMMMMMPAVY